MMKVCKNHSVGFKYAFAGIIWLLKKERNMRIHCYVAFIVIVSGCFIGFSLYEWIAVLFCIGAVLSAEAFNTAIEKLADYVCDEHNPMIGIVKDVAAGAVLIISILTVVIGLIILISRLNIYNLCNI